MAAVFRSEIVVDPEDQHIVDAHTWHTVNGYYQSGEGIYLHRYIIDSEFVDHKDGNGLNNKRDNIRPATKSQNSMNKGKHSDNTTGYKGVVAHVDGGFQAQIMYDGKQKYLGLYSSKEKAALAYNKAALEYHGEFAKLNEV